MIRHHLSILMNGGKGYNERGILYMTIQISSIQATQIIKPLSDGSFSTVPHKIICEDGHEYIAKFAQNPQGQRALVNEYILGKFAMLLQLPIPPFVLINLTDEIILKDQEFFSNEIDDVQPGIHFGSKVISKAVKVNTPGLVEVASNKEDILGIILFDHLTGNDDRHSNQGNLLFDISKKKIMMIDHSTAFDTGTLWDQYQIDHRIKEPIKAYNLDGALYKHLVQHVEGTFDSFVDKVKSLRHRDIESLVEDIPEEWECPLEDRQAAVRFLKHKIEHVDFIVKCIEEALCEMK